MFWWWWSLKHVCLSTNILYVRVKKDKSTEYIIGCKSKGLLAYKLFPLHCAFSPNIKYLGYKIRIQFNNNPLVVEQSNHKTKTVNAYIVYDLYNWPKIPLRNLTLKNSLLGVNNIRKDSDKSKYEYSGYGIPFDGLGIVFIYLSSTTGRAFNSIFFKSSILVQIVL